MHTDEQRLDRMEQHMANMMVNMTDILETVHFMRDTMATKEELHSVEKRLDNKIDRLESKVDRNHAELEAKVDRNHTEMLEHVDGFIGLNKDQEQEIFTLSARVERVEKKMDKVAS